MKSEQWRPSTALRKRRGRYVSTIEVSGLGSIMVVFVFLFVAPALVVVHPHGRSVDLPQSLHGSSQQGALREDALIVIITRDGSLFFGNARITPSELAPALKDRVKADSQRKVYLKADARTKYADVKAVLDQIRLAGIENVALMTYQTKH
jgi:biopolymer transport protein ExbD